MIIRRAQMDVFARADSPHFEADAVQHVKDSFLKHFRFLGEAGAMDAIQYGRNQSAGYGLSTSNYAMLFIDLTLLLGRRFDSDPQLPWAEAVLADETLAVDEKAQTLHQRAMDYLDLVSGPNNEYIDKAQSQLLKEPLEVTASPASPIDVKNRLKRVFPQKALYLGEEGLEQLVRNAAALAGRYGLATPHGVTLFAGMMFMLGSSFDSDPLFSWAATVLNDRQIGSPVERIQRLHAAGISYLNQWCA